ncbi:MAG: hypothetical protein Kow0069_21120 [Promethearchaeota archaeon]
MSRHSSDLEDWEPPSTFLVEHEEDLKLVEVYFFTQRSPKSFGEVERDLVSAGFAHLKGTLLRRLVRSLEVQYIHFNGGLKLHRTCRGTYQLGVRDEYYPRLEKMTLKREFTPRETKLLALVAYNQPVSLTRLRKLDSKVRLRELEALEARGMLTRTSGREGGSGGRGGGGGGGRRRGSWSTTPKFSEYFHLPQEPSRIRKILESRASQARSLSAGS